MAVPAASWRHAVHLILHERLAQVGYSRLVLGKVDPLPLPYALPVGQSQQNGVGGVQRPQSVVEQYPTLDWTRILISGYVGQPGDRLETGPVADVVLPGTGAAVGGGVQDDDVGFYLPQFGVVQAEVPHHPGRKILRHNVADADEFLEQFLAAVSVQVQRDAQLVAVGFVVHAAVVPRLVAHLAARLRAAPG